MAFVLGVNCKAYRNTGTYGSPTWNEVDNVSNMKISIKRDKADGTRRTGGGMKQYAGTLLDFTATWEMLWDLSDADFSAILAAATGNTEIDMIFLDGSVSSGSHQGPRISAGFEQLDPDQSESVVTRTSVTAFPGLGFVPVWFTGTA